MPRWLVVYGAAPIGAAMIDRSEVNRALAKAIAYKQCGKDDKANVWAIRLVKMLECADILADLPAEYTDIFGE